MTTNLFAIANVKTIANLGSFRILLPFFPNILVCWRPKFINFFNSFHNQVEFGTIFWRAFGISGGGFEHPNPPRVCHCFLPYISLFIIHNHPFIWHHASDKVALNKETK